MVTGRETDRQTDRQADRLRDRDTETGFARYAGAVIHTDMSLLNK